MGVTTWRRPASTPPAGPAVGVISGRREPYTVGRLVLASGVIAVSAVLALSFDALGGGRPTDSVNALSAVNSDGGGVGVTTAQPSLPLVVAPTPPHAPAARTPRPAGKHRPGGGAVVPLIPATAACGTTAAASTLQLLNRDRSGSGASDLSVDSGLCAAALLHAQQVAQRAEMSSNGLADDLRDAGVTDTNVRELLASSGATLDPLSVNDLWMSSEGGQSGNIRDMQYRHVGIAWSRIGDGDWYVSAIVGR